MLSDTKQRDVKNRSVVTLLIIILLLSASINFAQKIGGWVKADFHIHTTMSDGDHTPSEIAQMAFLEYDLDLIAFSDHSGPYFRVNNDFQKINGLGEVLPIQKYIPLMKSEYKKYKNYCRSLTLIEKSFPEVLRLREKYNEKLIVQGLEFNVPGHEHSCIGIISDSVIPLSKFHFLFDRNSTLNSFDNLLHKQNENTHENALVALSYLEDNYKDKSYFIVNHPSRKLLYNISQIRDFCNTAPNVVMGFEGFPGHQLKDNYRGGYNNNFGDSLLYHSKTYGGADFMLAKVGGVWDAMLGEGRNFWVFANSDFHRPSEDGWPGQFAKNYIWMKEKSYLKLNESLKEGKIFIVTGNLLNDLDFRIKTPSKIAEMGQTLFVENASKVKIVIGYKTDKNNESLLDHIDLICGDVLEYIDPKSEQYSQSINSSTKILKTFNKNEFKKSDDGFSYISYEKIVTKSQYFRLRGTNLPKNTENETDENGNPLCDELVGPNEENLALKDLWFYSNPIFIKVLN